jgi:hypothetical protein
MQWNGCPCHIWLTKLKIKIAENKKIGSVEQASCSSLWEWSQRHACMCVAWLLRGMILNSWSEFDCFSYVFQEHAQVIGICKKKPSFFLSLLKQVKTTTLNPGANPTSIVSYNASAVNIYNATSSLTHIEIKILLLWKTP